MKTKNTQWFTLIEMLIVIAVIGILFWLFAMKFEVFAERARDTARTADWYNLGVGLIEYVIDNDASFPESPSGCFDENVFNAISWYTDELLIDPKASTAYGTVAWWCSPYYGYALLTWVNNWSYFITQSMENPANANFVLSWTDLIDRSQTKADLYDTRCTWWVEKWSSTIVCSSSNKRWVVVWGESYPLYLNLAPWDF